MAKRPQSNTQQPDLFGPWNEQRLAGLALALGAEAVDSVSQEEQELIRNAQHFAAEEAVPYRDAIAAGEDPLGDHFCALRSPAIRRTLGATYTPKPIIASMLRMLPPHSNPMRVVDPGCGTARFLATAARAYPSARLVGVEVDPLAALLARANLAVLGCADRSEVLVQDFRALELAPAPGPTLFIGNPPYVRHHQISLEWKAWLQREAQALGYSASGLAGLHVYFYLAVARIARLGDFGAFVTASEWLDVNYGSLVRSLFTGPLGGHSLTVLEPEVQAFPDAATTAAITCFQIGEVPQRARLARVASLTSLDSPDHCNEVGRERLLAEKRWSHLTYKARTVPADHVELGELCRVHRGAVTGANQVWIAGPHSAQLPERYQYASVTRARDLLSSGEELRDGSWLRRVIDLPEDLAELEPDERKIVERFLRFAEGRGADQTYIARNRRAWWTVGLRKPAPILATYMARRPPHFVRNVAEARHINIAHGLYPRQPLDEDVLLGLARFLSHNTSVRDGRTYAGGLTKFEPREMERLLVPRPEFLAGYEVV